MNLLPGSVKAPQLYRPHPVRFLTCPWIPIEFRLDSTSTRRGSITLTAHQTQTYTKKNQNTDTERPRERKNLHIAICHGPKTRRILKNELSSKNYGDRSNKKKLARRIYAWKSQRKPMKASKIIIIIEVVKVKWEILTIDLLICISILELK